jgi:creatinine amidohydrolase
MRLWQELAWTDFAGLPPDTVAVLPLAAVEQHGPHLPLSTDAEINAGLLARATALLRPGAPVLLLPPQLVGLSPEHLRFPGTITGSPESLLALWGEIGESVARAGVKRLLLFNSHGGQPQLLDLLARRLRSRCGMLAVACTWFRFGLPAGLVDAAEERYGIHGGLVETSLMLALRPDLVRMDRATHFRSAWEAREAEFRVLEPEGTTGFGWETQDLNPQGALGNAAAATAATGEAILSHVAPRLTALIEEMRRFEPDGFLHRAPASPA